MPRRLRSALAHQRAETPKHAVIFRIEQPGLVQALHGHVGLLGADRRPSLCRQSVAGRRAAAETQRAVANEVLVGFLEIFRSNNFRLAEHRQFVGSVALRDRAVQRHEETSRPTHNRNKEYASPRQMDSGSLYHR